jgi:phosphatidylglycerophosphate synthase
VLDAILRPLIDRPLDHLGRRFARAGVSADAVTVAGLLAGLAASAALSARWSVTGLVLILASRVLDGLDGAVARAGVPSDRGAYLDVVCDYAFYAAIPLGFAFADPERNALPAAALLASFTLTCATFLGFATLAAKRGLETAARGRKSFFYSPGLVEGFETIAVFCAMAVRPALFPALAWITAALCLLTILQRSWLALATFPQDPPPVPSTTDPPQR